MTRAFPFEGSWGGVPGPSQTPARSALEQGPVLAGFGTHADPAGADRSSEGRPGGSKGGKDSATAGGACGVCAGGKRVCLAVVVRCGQVYNRIVK